MADIEVRLRQIRHEAEGIASYELAALDRGPLPAFTAGAHIDLRLPGGLVRSYSLVNPPGDHGRYVIAVQRDPDSRGGSAWLHQVPRVGDRLTITHPSNHFPLVEDAELSVFIAGGIGVTPFMAMARRLQALGRPWHLHYASRSPERAAFADALQALGAQPGGQVKLYFSSQGSPRPDIAALVRDAPAHAHLYCCGPARMLDDYLKACQPRRPAFVHHERFASTQEAASSGGYEVVLQRSRRTITVAPGKTMLDSLLDQGIDVQYACSQGICGTCKTDVLEGEPDHRDEYLTEAEKAGNQSVMVCCSGSRSARLVLDM